jgi:hypothetical protein
MGHSESSSLFPLLLLRLILCRPLTLQWVYCCNGSVLSEGGILSSSLWSGSSIFPLPILQCSLNLHRGGINALFRAESPSITCSHLVAPGVCTFIIVHWKETILWLSLGVALVVGIDMVVWQCPFNWTTVFMFPPRAHHLPCYGFPTGIIVPGRGMLL